MPAVAGVWWELPFRLRGWQRMPRSVRASARSVCSPRQWGSRLLDYRSDDWYELDACRGRRGEVIGGLAPEISPECLTGCHERRTNRTR